MSDLELKLDFMLGVYGIPPMEKEHRFHTTRRWRFDRAYVEQKIAVEVEGGIWSKGRHSRGKGFSEDCTKYNNAAALGWTVFRITTEHIDKDPDSFFPMFAAFIRENTDLLENNAP